MAVIKVAIVEFCRWIFGGGRLAFSSSSSSSKSKLTVLSAFLVFLVVLTASLFAISSTPLFSSGSFSSSASSSSSALLSWFFSPSAASTSFDPRPPTPPLTVPLLPPPSAPQEQKAEGDGSVSESVRSSVTVPPPPPPSAPQERKAEGDGSVSESARSSVTVPPPPPPSAPQERKAKGDGSVSESARSSVTVPPPPPPSAPQERKAKGDGSVSESARSSVTVPPPPPPSATQERKVEGDGLVSESARSPLAVPPPPPPSTPQERKVEGDGLVSESARSPLAVPPPPPPSAPQERKAEGDGSVSESARSPLAVPPPPPPSAPQERKVEGDGLVSESARSSLAVPPPPPSAPLERKAEGDGLVSASGSPPTLLLTTDASNGGQIPKEVAFDKSIPSESQSSNITTSCGGRESGNSTTGGACSKGQIIVRKNATDDQDHQINEHHREEKNQGGGRPSGTVEAAVTKAVDAAKSNSSSSSVDAKAAALPVEVKAMGGRSESAPCDIFDGRWVWDEKNEPYYPPGSCPHIDDDFNCHKNGRLDRMFLKWRWQPFGCDIPRLNASDFLQRLRGKRLIFVGDSLNRNMWESLVCILRNSIENKNRVYEVSGRRQFKTKGRKRQSKTKGYYSFKFADYECSVDFVRSTFLVKEVPFKNENGLDDERLRLDLMDETTVAYKEADVIVFNTGHWWTHEKTSKGINYYQEGNHVYPVLKVMEAFKRALTTWSRWIDKNIDTRKTEVIFRGYSLTHFRGGQWNSGGQCHKETEPIFNQTYLSKYPSKMRALEYILKGMRTPVVYLNISRLTDYRKDGHPSIYRQRYASVEEQIAAEKYQDCSHWCLPGVPDSWNELLYASLLIAGRGSWGKT